MSSHILSTLIFALCASALTAVATQERSAETLATDYGPALKDVLLELVANISETGPIILLPPEVRLPLNVTEVVEAVVGRGNDIPLKGNLTAWSLGIAVENSVEIPVSYVNLNGILNPLNISLLANIPNVALVGEYNIDGTLLETIAIRGTGKFSVSLDLTAGVVGEMKVFPTPNSPVAFLTFDYPFALRAIKVNLEGLEGDMGGLINDAINGLIAEKLTPALIVGEARLHSTVKGVIMDTVNVFVAKLTYQDILAILEGLLRPPALAELLEPFLPRVGWLL